MAAASRDVTQKRAEASGRGEKYRRFPDHRRLFPDHADHQATPPSPAPQAGMKGQRFRGHAHQAVHVIETRGLAGGDMAEGNA
jgi:hypothetical protein